MKLTLGAIYTLKVGLFAQKYNQTNTLGQHGLVEKGSQVFYDQEAKSGRHVFGLFPPYQEMYVIVPKDYLEESIELVDDKNLVPRKE